MLIVSFTFLCTHVSVFRAIIKGWRDRPGPDMGKTAQLQRERVGAGMTADACMHTMVSSKPDMFFQFTPCTCSKHSWF